MEKKLFDDVFRLYKTTVLDKNPVFINTALDNKKTNKRQCSRPRLWDVDLAVSNCPEDVRTHITDNALRVLKYWKAQVLPKLMATKPLQGRAESYLRAAVLSLARCCYRGGVQPGTKAELSFMGNTSDANLKEIVNNHTAIVPVVSRPQIIFPTTMELVDETLEAMCNTIYKHWSRAYKSYVANMSVKLPSSHKKFGATIHFVNVWYRVVKRYADTPNNHERDLVMKNMMSVEDTLEKYPTNTPLYPLHTPSGVIVGDYAFKLLVEVILSPHIHPEWKISMCKFLDKDINKMLISNGVQVDIEKAAALIGELVTDEGDTMKQQDEEASEGRGLAPGEGLVFESARTNGKKYNPVQILPTSTTFLDFCKGYSSPSEIKYCMMFNEPSTHIDLASGAGMFGRFSGTAMDVNSEEVRVAFSCLTNLLGTTTVVDNNDANSISISTRHWREGGEVLCFNFCPVTFKGAVKGYGEEKTKNVPAGFWVKTIQRALTDSIKRKRNAADKGSRNSDLLSDEGCSKISTVTFGCESMLKALTGMSTFNVLLSYHDPIQANNDGSDRLYAETRVVSHSFPPIL